MTLTAFLLAAVLVDPVDARWTFGNHEPYTMYRRIGRRSTGGIDGNARWVKDWQNWFDSRACTSLMKGLGLNMLHSRFYKGMGWEVEKEDFPAVKSFVANCHADGVKALAYVQFATLYSETFPKEAPDYEDWLMRDENGKPRIYGPAYYRHMPCITNPKWVEYLKRMCTIALTEGGFDGIMFDNLFVHPCYCTRCQRLFHEHLMTIAEPATRFGFGDLSLMRIPTLPNPNKPGEVRDPLMREWLVWRARTTDDVVAQLAAHIRSVKPDAIVTGNTHPFRTPSILSLCGTDLYSLSRHFDILLQQNDNAPVYSRDGSMTSRIRELKLAAEFGKVPLLLCDQDAGACDFDESRYLLPLWEDLIFGGIPTDRTVICPQTDPPAFYDKARVEQRKPALARFNAFAAVHRDILKAPSWKPVRLLLPTMAVMTSEACHDNLAAAEEIFIRNRVPFGYVVSQPDQPLVVPKDAEVLVVAGQFQLSDGEIAAIADWAKKGGRLVVTGDCGRYDECNAQRFENPLAVAVKKMRNVVWLDKTDKLNGRVQRGSRVNRPADGGVRLMDALRKTGWRNPFAFGLLPESVVAEYKRTADGIVALLLDFADGSEVKVVREAVYPGYREAFERIKAADKAADEAWIAAAGTPEFARRREAVSAAFAASRGDANARVSRFKSVRVGEPVVRDGYRVEHLLVEGMPGFHITASVYVPHRPECQPPYPGVVIPCGHSLDGKSSEVYRNAAAMAARAGFVSVVFDPVGQGERAVQDRPLGDLHNAYGAMANLLGESFLQIRLDDCRLMVDYLVSRSDVNPDQICAMGNSGGGTMTAMLAATEPRLKAVAPASYISHFDRVVESAGPQDGEQIVFGQFAFGLNMAGLLLLNDAPALVCANQTDFFPFDGTETTMRVLKCVSEKLGKPDRYALCDQPGYHGWKPAAIDASIAWMREKLGLAAQDPVSWKGASAPAEQVTETGNVRDLPGERSLFSIYAERAAVLSKERSGLSLAEKRAKAVELARIRPLGSCDPAKDGLTVRFAEQGCVLTVDADGFVGDVYGRQRPHTSTCPWDELGKMHYLLGESLVGHRAEAICAKASQMKRRLGRRVKLVARGVAAVAAAHALAAEPKLFSSVKVENPPPSWTEQIKSSAQVTYSEGVHGALRFYDWTEILP